jgi:hypothetical protein
MKKYLDDQEVIVANPATPVAPAADPHSAPAPMGGVSAELAEERKRIADEVEVEIEAKNNELARLREIARHD